jgi:tRNA pseudouridine55 synthase
LNGGRDRDVSGILLLDKPAGMTSNAALQRVRRLYRADKAGHTGSLDPLATGLLPICLGQATKLSGYLLEADKRYRVRAAVGACTDTADAEGQVVRRSDPAGLTRQMLESALPGFIGEIRQRPPVYSALKRGGRPLYERARAGEVVEVEARPVRIDAIELLAFGPGFFELDVRCGKGTYIRSLVEDLAAAVGQCAHVSALRRLEAGPFREDGMVTPGALERAAEQGTAALDALLLDPAAGLPAWPRARADAAQAARLAHGQALRPDGPAPPPGPVAVLDAEGRLLGIAEADAAGVLHPRRWLA